MSDPALEKNLTNENYCCLNMFEIMLQLKFTLFVRWHAILPRVRSIIYFTKFPKNLMKCNEEEIKLHQL